MAEGGTETAAQIYPLHWSVWHNDIEALKAGLLDGQNDKELLDPRGRTALHLAVTLGHLESARVLLRHGANANSVNSKYWTVIQEAVSTGDPELVQLCLQYRDYQRFTQRTEGVPGLLNKLRQAPDFYVEMKWEFTSWVPLVSRMCPSDTYKVYKSGSSVRIDTTLLGFDNMNWQRGSRSFVFKGEEDSALVMEIDHDAHQVFTERMQILPEPTDVEVLRPSEDQVAARITAPMVTTYIDTDKISFERSKQGLWGWRSDRTETVNEHQCKVYCASNVELVTKTRTEHLTEQDKQRSKKDTKTPLESFLGIAEQQERQQAPQINGEVSQMSNNPCCISPEDYFNPKVSLEGRDIGRPIEQATKTQKFKATLWLCDDFPLSLQEQVLPIIDLMASNNAHFKKLRDFITLQLPSGFPIKIEIPLFHVLNARITFGNIFAGDTAVPGVTTIRENDAVCCTVDETCFDTPSMYSTIGDGRHERIRDEDDELLQFAIQQSLLDAGTENEQVTFWEALNKKTRGNHNMDLQAEEERLLQRALEESMMLSKCGENPAEPVIVEESQESESLPPPPPVTHPQRSLGEDEQLRLALELSQQELEEESLRRKEEEEELEMILKLSLTEK